MFILILSGCKGKPAHKATISHTSPITTQVYIGNVKKVLIVDFASQYSVLADTSGISSAFLSEHRTRDGAPVKLYQSFDSIQLFGNYVAPIKFLIPTRKTYAWPKGVDGILGADVFKRGKYILYKSHIHSIKGGVYGSHIRGNKLKLVNGIFAVQSYWGDSSVYAILDSGGLFDYDVIAPVNKLPRGAIFYKNEIFYRIGGPTRVALYIDSQKLMINSNVNKRHSIILVIGEHNYGLPIINKSLLDNYIIILDFDNMDVCFLSDPEQFI